MPLSRLHSFSDFIARYIPGKVQKITVNTGFICPNRNGEKGRGGCIYCNNSSFTPAYALGLDSVENQIEQGKQFFSRKYPQMQYLAYFQSYTSTNAPVDEVVALYKRALAVESVVGIVVGTRPDCMSDALLQALKELSTKAFVMVEYGAESANDNTLRLINRCHSWADTVSAVERTARAGLPVGLHLIMGLPGESTQDMLHTIDQVNALPVSVLKFHHLQVVRGTRLEQMVACGEVTLEQYTPESYADLCIKLLSRLRSDIHVERLIAQGPPQMVVSPKWNLKNYQFMDLLRNRLR